MDDMMNAMVPVIEPVKLQVRLELLKEKRVILNTMYEIGTLRKEDYDTKLCDILHDIGEMISKTY